MDCYILCPRCAKAVLLRRKLMLLFKKGTMKNKPDKVRFCPICTAYIKMEESLERFRYPWKLCDSKFSNCIVSCGYGMFAPRYYKETVIDARRGYKPKYTKDKTC